MLSFILFYSIKVYIYSNCSIFPLLGTVHVTISCKLSCFLYKPYDSMTKFYENLKTRDIWRQKISLPLKQLKIYGNIYICTMCPTDP